LATLINKIKIFCPYANGSLNVKHEGSCVCYKGRSIIPIDNANNIDEFINNDEMKKIRLSLSEGVWPKNCLPCKEVEDLNQQSARNKVARSLKFKNKKWLIDNLNDDGSINNLLYLELRFKNTCNLACRHCTPAYSTKWNKVVEQLREQNYYSKREYKESLSKKISVKDWVDFIKHQIDSDAFKKDPELLFYLELTGGEPFFQLEFYDFLELLNELPEYKERIQFCVTTNGIIADRFKKYDLKKLLSGFGLIWIKLSLDASKEFYDYFRQGGTWKEASSGVDRILNNLIQTNKKKVSISVSPTVFQCLRFDDMYYDFKELFQNWKINNGKISVSDIFEPTYLKINNIHPDLKKILIKQIEKSKIKINDPMFDNMVDLTLKQLYQAGDIREWKNFCDMTQRLDKIHGKNVFDFFPELQEYWSK